MHDLDEMVARLKQAGYELGHWGAEHPHRKNVYSMEAHRVQFECVEYFSNQSSERNDDSY